MMTLHKRDDIPVKLIGSWTTSIGPIQDQAGNIPYSAKFLAG